jgi:hypothetical protein
MKTDLFLLAIMILTGCNNPTVTNKENLRSDNTFSETNRGFAEKKSDVSLLSAATGTGITSIPAGQKNTRPVRIIFDTDMDSDVDDVGALAMLNAMMDNGKVEILAVMVSSTCTASAACADAINTFYGRPDIPIGIKKGKGVNRSNGYVDKVAEKFPHDLGNASDIPDAKSLYRKILSEQPDKSVRIVTVGYLSNLEDLLKTSADKYSKLNGRDLVKSKVSEFFCVGGKYPDDLSFEGNGNFEPDGKAVKYVNEYWPAMITFIAGEQYFWDVKTGARLMKESNMDRNPVAYAYKVFHDLVTWDTLDPEHHSADQIGTYVAVNGFENKYTLTKTSGYFHIWDNGLCEWRTDSYTPLRRVSYSLKEPYKETAANFAAEIGNLMLQKPKKTKFSK